MKKGCWSCCYWLWSSRFILIPSPTTSLMLMSTSNKNENVKTNSESFHQPEWVILWIGINKLKNYVWTQRGWNSVSKTVLHMRMYVTMRQVLQKAVIRCSPVPKHVRSEILALMRHYAGEIWINFKIWQLLNTVNFIIGNYVKEMDRQDVLQLSEDSLLICVQSAYPRDKVDNVVDYQLFKNVNLVVASIHNEWMTL